MDDGIESARHADQNGSRSSNSWSSRVGRDRGAISTPAPALQADPGCDAFGWRHPLCGGGAWDQSASSEWGPSASTEAGLDAAQEPSMVPNIDGSLSPPGTPGAI
ncbi:MAG: hypothetical protein ACXWEI_02970 [Mycobacterium sp.]